MTGKSSAERRATDALKTSMTQVFEAAGAEFIEPDIIQPADVFLERSGEHIRSRTYVFADPAGAQLCLRPDLTVPACRYHLEQADDVNAAARYCYAGKAFRHSDSAADTSVREFDQVGLEFFGDGCVAGDDAEVLALTLSALDRAGAGDYTIQLGDLGLFAALLASIEMPERWRTRLKRQFWRPRAFRDLVNRLTGRTPQSRTSLSDLLDEMGDSTLDAVAFVEHKLEAGGLEMIGGRSIEQVAGRLSEKLLDRSEPHLSGDHAKLIDDYLAIRCPLPLAVAELKRLDPNAGSEYAAAVELFEARVEAIGQAGLDTAAIEFAAVFGRSLEYYTGFVFQIDRALPDGASQTIAGGGRYDTMLKDIGAEAMIPAVGCAIYADRLATTGEAAA